MPNNSQPLIKPEYWWERTDLGYRDGYLHLAGQDLKQFAEEYGTPLYICNSHRVIENIQRLSEALKRATKSHRLYYAMKANRNPDLLNTLSRSGFCGIDACSPREVQHALDCGFKPEQISVTATAVSEQDWSLYQNFEGIEFNADSISTIKRIAQNRYRTRIGLRLNPSVGVGYRDNHKVRYAGGKATKFGIYPDRFEEAVNLCNEAGIQVAGLHIHAGSGFLDDSFSRYREALTLLVKLSDGLSGLEYLNIGGGLGVPLTNGDQPLDLEKWSEIISDTVGQTGLTICTEPGNYIVKDSGVLLCEVVESEEKGGTIFTYVNAGFNLHPEPAYYGLPMEPVPVRETDPSERFSCTLAGNINEALDIFYENISMNIGEGDLLAMLNAGAYGSSMSSNHCMRGDIKEIVL